MKGNSYNYPDKESKIGFEQILSLLRAPEISIPINGQWRGFG